MLIFTIGENLVPLYKLWGNNFFNSQTRRWESDVCESEGGFERGFNKFVLDPIYKGLNITLENDYDKLNEICDKLELKIKLTSEQNDTFKGRDLLKYFMKKWLPAADAMLELIILHLPSPIEAQQYRTSGLYEGPMDDQAAIGIRQCDPNAHLMIYISKMLPSAGDKNRFTHLGVYLVAPQLMAKELELWDQITN